jgi:MoxR-like ATPase
MAGEVTEAGRKKLSKAMKNRWKNMSKTAKAKYVKKATESRMASKKTAKKKTTKKKTTKKKVASRKTAAKKRTGIKKGQKLSKSHREAIARGKQKAARARVRNSNGVGDRAKLRKAITKGTVDTTTAKLVQMVLNLHGAEPIVITDQVVALSIEDFMKFTDAVKAAAE